MTATTRLVSGQRIDMLLVREGICASIHICVARSTGSASFKAEVLVMTPATRYLLAKTALMSQVIKDHSSALPVAIDEKCRGNS